MGADGRFWKRDELYEEVWATPIKTLAKKYGISDVGLAIVCRKLSIPLPGRGYWARKEVGQSVEQGSPFGDWVIWAELQADRLDPLKESPASIIDQRTRTEPAYTGYYGYQKPDPPFRFPKPIWRMN